MKAAAYIRVSTPQQATEEKVSLDEQRKDLKTFCASGELGHRIVQAARE